MEGNNENCINYFLYRATYTKCAAENSQLDFMDIKIPVINPSP